VHIRYKPRIKFPLNALGVTGRETIDYATRYARLEPQITATTTYTPPPTTLQPIEAPPVISVPISPPASFFEPPVTVFPSADSAMPIDTAFVPETFVYSKDQILDMLTRGASETFERTGETESGLPIAAELEQKSRELDATKNYVVNAEGEIIPVEPKATGGGLALLAAAVAGFLLLGG